MRTLGAALPTPVLNPFRRDQPDREAVVTASPTGLGTFGGVFTPSILTVLGVIMYLRFGWVIGNVGLVKTLVIVTLATLITFLTALSIAAISTDQRVRAGGAYYMISRSLGIETGGAVGIPLYLAQALSVALYTIGFAESVTLRFPGADLKVVGLITAVAVAVLALISAQVAIRAQYFIMAAIVLSLLAVAFGHEATLSAANAADGPPVREGFWTVFAVFFPAVTGIMAGVNLSGDLRDPSRAIPRGTFAAVGVGYLIYMTLPFVLYYRAPMEALIEDPLIMTRKRVSAMEHQIQDYLAERAVQALVRVIAAPDPFQGAERLVDSYGLGALVPNTIVLGDTQDPTRTVRYGETIRHFFQSRRNVVIVRDGAAAGYGARQHIDVWWSGLTGNGGLMLILAYLLQSSLEWRGSTVRIQMVAPNAAAAQEMEATVGERLRQTRTGAELHVIPAQGRPFDQILRETSADADLVLLGLAAPDEVDFATYYTDLRARTAGLPATLFVLAAEDIAFGQVLA